MKSTTNNRSPGVKLLNVIGTVRPNGDVVFSGCREKSILAIIRPLPRGKAVAR